VLILGIESSCDEMAAAVLDHDGKTLRSNIVHSQAELHSKYGGVVPELASRDHVRIVSQVIKHALESANTELSEIDAIAVTAGPGLVGSLLCGVEAAKGLALATKKPLIGIHHLEGHIAATFLEEKTPQGPFVSLIVSGGHTSLIYVPALGEKYTLLGATRDDAAGEAFDKTAKLLGLGYPGGVKIDQLSQSGDRKRFRFPQAMPGKDNLEFSFSGLKTAAARVLKEHESELDDQGIRDFCASFQNAIVENLIRKAFRACVKMNTKELAFVGGVAANSRLRERAMERSRREKYNLYLPSKKNCTDNAAMIARAGFQRFKQDDFVDLTLSCRSHWPLAQKVSD